MDEKPVIQKAADELILSIALIIRLFKEKQLVSILAVLTIGVFAEAEKKIIKPLIVKIIEWLGISNRTDHYNHVHYSTFLYIIAGFLVGIIIIRILNKKGLKPDSESSYDIIIKSPIKGLQSYEREDHELFLRLQRSAIVEECCNAILPDDFRFGVLIGESGCGKSSLLKAGLLPEIEKHKHRTVYIKFSDLSPLQSIRSSIKKQLCLSEAQKGRLAGANLAESFEIATDSNSVSCLFVFDQFEQFFTHNKLEERRKPFIDEVADWYKNRPDSSVKVLVGVREDFRGRLLEFQKGMGCNILLHHEFLLKKFTKNQAISIFEVLAAEEHLTIDKGFLETLCERELSSDDDGMISGVDIQILAVLIKNQEIAEEKNSFKNSYIRPDGIEGLLYHYVEKVLSKPVDNKEMAIKVLLVFIDPDRNVRKGPLTKEQITAGFPQSVDTAGLQNILEYFSSSGVRILTPHDNEGVVSFELSHEKLIAPIRKIAGAELKSAEKLNLLLNKQVAYWIESNRSNKFLLSLRDLLQVRKEWSLIVWGEKKEIKLSLIEQSRRRLYRTAEIGIGAMATIGAVIVLAPLIGNVIERLQLRSDSKKNMIFISAHDVNENYRMGSDSLPDATPHQVRFAYDFWIRNQELTQKDYLRLMNGNPSNSVGDNRPVETVTWYDAIIYCNKRSRIEGYDTVYYYRTIEKIKTSGNELSDVEIHYEKNGFRLPSEAEWEFACRAGSRSEYYWGNDTSNIDKYCWTYQNSGGTTQKVGQKEPNNFHLHDMSGNVWEWCNDWYGEYSGDPAIDPIGPKIGTLRVLRGGSCNDYAWNCRSAYRNYLQPGKRYSNFGFRLCRGQREQSK